MLDVNTTLARKSGGHTSLVAPVDVVITPFAEPGLSQTVMDSSTHTRQRRTRRGNDSRKHVRPLDGAASVRDDESPQPVRSRPSERVTPRDSGTQSRRFRRNKRSSSGIRRMQPRSQSRGRVKPRIEPSAEAAEEAVSLGQRRAARRARKRSQVTRASAPRTQRRFSLFSLMSWRLVSGVIVIGLIAVLYLFLTADAFFVSAVGIGGERYLTREEIFRYSDVAQQHIFWVDADDVEARLEAVPNIADAQVLIGWPPDMVQLLVVEREPALIWEQEIRVWVDVNGIVMKLREDRSDLLRIVVQDVEEPIAVGQVIPRTIVDGALQLKRRYPDISVLLYDSLTGLGHRDTRGWTVWFGTGEDIDTKLLVYNALVEEIYPDIQPGEIDMSDPDRPSFTVLWRNG